MDLFVRPVRRTVLDAMIQQLAQFVSTVLLFSPTSALLLAQLVIS